MPASELIQCPHCTAQLELPTGIPDGKTMRCGSCSERFTLSATRRVEKPELIPPPSELGRFRVVDMVAKGGMGQVLRARDPVLEREVAVKTLLRHGKTNQLRRFRVEARVTGQLDHPGIPPVHDLGVGPDGTPFFVMKLIRGEGLDFVLKAIAAGDPEHQRRWPRPRLLGIFVQLCNAVAFAHDRGVIHRDLKPGNVLLGHFGEVYLIDWGLAKELDGAQVQERESDQVPAAEEGEITLDGVVVGSPGWMSPEQARGERVDERSDIFSLGAILHQILTGRHPVPGDNMRARLDATAEGRIPQLDLSQRGGPPAGLAAVVNTAIAVDPEQRYASVEALRDDVEAWLDGRALSVQGEGLWDGLKRLWRRHTAVVSLGGLAALLVLVGAIVVTVQESRRRQERRASAPAFIAMARDALQRRQVDQAEFALKAALAADDTLDEARKLRIWAPLARRDFAAAQLIADELRRANPDDPLLERLAELSSSARREAAPAVLQNLAEIATREGLGGVAKALVEGSDAAVAAYQRGLELAWPKAAIEITLRADRALKLVLRNLPPEADLEALRGLPLASLELRCPGGKAYDLSPLKGAPLEDFDCEGLPIRDLSPLAGAPLSRLRLHGAEIGDLAPLSGTPIRNLELIPAILITSVEALRATRLERLAVSRLPKGMDFSPLAGAPLRELFVSYSPGVGLVLPSWPSLESLTLAEVRQYDAAQLKGLRLKRLELPGSPLSEVAVLAGQPIEQLVLSGTRIADLKFLRGLPLRRLDLAGTGVGDLTALAGLALNDLTLRNCAGIRDLAPLKGLPLKNLDLSGLPPAVSLAPLAGSALESLVIDSDRVAREMTFLRSLVRLRKLNGQAVDTVLRGP